MECNRCVQSVPPCKAESNSSLITAICVHRGGALAVAVVGSPAEDPGASPLFLQDLRFSPSLLHRIVDYGRLWRGTTVLTVAERPDTARDLRGDAERSG